MTTITRLEQNDSILLDDLSMTDQTRLFFTTLLQAIDEQTVISGTGSPEGVIEALPLKEYMDINGVAGAIKYIKRDADIAGDKALGWVLV